MLLVAVNRIGRASGQILIGDATILIDWAYGAEKFKLYPETEFPKSSFKNTSTWELFDPAATNVWDKVANENLELGTELEKIGIVYVTLSIGLEIKIDPERKACNLSYNF